MNKLRITKEEFEKHVDYNDLLDFLKKHKGVAYCLRGLMVDVLNFDESELDKPYDEWSQKVLNEYGRLRRYLLKMRKLGLIEYKSGLYGFGHARIRWFRYIGDEA